jgi:DNA (cytosine-5)-methyltransferase 1
VKYVSAFAGIGGFEQGFALAGMTPTCLIEWNPQCQRVLATRYSATPLMGDIADVSGTDLGKPDVAVGGFPCQDTSIAAPHRAGLAGQRSGHFHEFTRLVREYQRLVDASNPRWVVIENPPGLLKSNEGRDLATVVRSLEELG